MSKIDQVIVALDNMSKEEIFSFISSHGHEFGIVKIGLEMFCKHGPELVLEIHQEFNKNIFLDLKLHDIPNTVAKSIHSLKGLPIEFLTIHLGGGKDMIINALQAASESLPHTKLLGVSYLTSLGDDDLFELWNINNVQQAFERLFKVAINSKIHGVVLSSRELPWVSEIESSLDGNLVKVCPGIRFEDEINSNNTQDQKRVETPASAFSKGANYLVMGRSITQSKNINTRIEYLKSLN